MNDNTTPNIAANENPRLYIPTLGLFESIQLEDLQKVQLLNRVDTKYIFHHSDLDGILFDLKEEYYVLEINGKKLHTYETLYFDTPDLLLYKFHHNGKVNRLKVRYRRYADTGLTFFEVKYKVKGSRTDKIRLNKADIFEDLGTEEQDLIRHYQVDPACLQKRLWVYFVRITIAKKDYSERATLDVGLRFKNGDIDASYEDICVAEIKQNKTSFSSPLIKALKSRHLEKSGFSKYSMGIAATENVKSNRFKPNFIKIDKIRNGNS